MVIDYNYDFKFHCIFYILYKELDDYGMTSIIIYKNKWLVRICKAPECIFMHFMHTLYARRDLQMNFLPANGNKI